MIWLIAGTGSSRDRHMVEALEETYKALIAYIANQLSLLAQPQGD